MGLDVGDVRIGVALSRSGVIAEPLTTVTRKGRRQVLDDLQQLVDQHKVTICVVGLPRLVGGSEGEQAEKTRAFVRSLRRRIPQLRFVFEDERFTSAEAKEILGARSSQKGSIDRVAAALILQQYLDRPAQDRSQQTSELPEQESP
jgi:putative Holliday junction resolvase